MSDQFVTVAKMAKVQPLYAVKREYFSFYSDVGLAIKLTTENLTAIRDHLAERVTFLMFGGDAIVTINYIIQKLPAIAENIQTFPTWLLISGMDCYQHNKPVINEIDRLLDIAYDSIDRALTSYHLPIERRG